MDTEFLELQSQGLRINYRQAGPERGAAPGVVLLHCSSSHSGQWSGLIELLSPDFSVAALDLAGYGRSDPLPDDGAPYFVHDVAAVADLVAQLGAPLHLVGHSLGGTVALQFARQFPQAVQSLTLIEPVQFSLLEEVDAPELAEFHLMTGAMFRLFEQGRGTGAARHFVDFWTSTGDFDAMDAKTRRYIEGTVGRVVRESRVMIGDVPGQITLAEIGAINVVTQLICGGGTRDVAKVIIRLIDGAMPNSVLTTIPGANHMAAVIDPAAINGCVAGFLAAQLS